MHKDKSIMVDYAKTIGIVMVVSGHTAWIPFGTLNPYFFHMQLFFFLGGYLLNTKKDLSSFYCGIIKKHFLYIISTYIIVGLIAVLIHNLVGNNINIGEPFSNGVFETIKNALSENMHNNLYFLVAWFILAYMISISIVFLLMKLSILIKVNNVYSVLFFATCFYMLAFSLNKIHIREQNQLLNVAIQVSMASVFMFIGILFRHLNIKFNSIIISTILFIAISFMISSNNYGIAIMSWSDYKYGIFTTIVASTAIIYIVMCISFCLSMAFPNSVITTIGRNSKGIMSYHLVIFLVIDCIFYYFLNYDISKTTPTHHYYSEFSGMLYLTMPILIIVFLNSVKNKIIK
ncbi:acyltransferase family protein [Morganella morganii subsp. morganii]|uniref:acyltransferase family protein n=1 Tax=Morganella morganii TaxID=582 RepID=UPI001BDA04EF|nr:acyltransferase family protein [Morganella morganii]MBT0394452.1 acyltransferase family protein [Morganella morganii subsp. morganii]